MSSGTSKTSRVLQLLGLLQARRVWTGQELAARLSVTTRSVRPDIERLRAFYRTYYQPDNAVIVIAGAFDPQKTLAWIAKSFGAIPKPSSTLPRRRWQELPPTSTRESCAWSRSFARRRPWGSFPARSSR